MVNNEIFDSMQNMDETRDGYSDYHHVPCVNYIFMKRNSNELLLSLNWILNALYDSYKIYTN